MSKRAILLLASFFFLLPSCLPSPAPLPAETAASPNLAPFDTAQGTPATATPDPVALITETPSATPVPPPSRPQYVMDVQFNYTNKSAQVNEIILYTNNTPDTLVSLVLAVEPTCSYSFTLNTLMVDGQPVNNYVFDSQNIQAYIRHRLEIPLPRPLPPNGQVTVQIGFGLVLPVVANFTDETSLCSQIYGYTAQQVNLVDWYPFIVPYIAGKGWVLHNPWYYGEHLTFEAADFDVSVAFTDGVKPVIASSGEQVPSADTDKSRFRIEAGRTFALSFALEYRVLSTTAGDVTIYSYYFPPYETAANAVLKATAQSFEIYSQRYGPYPHKTLSVVQGDFNDGMEYSGLYYHSKGIYNNYDGTLMNHLTAVSVHETAHQWWFEQVANDQGFEPWLDESLATYSEIVYYETVQPDVLTKWWWTYRFDPYVPLNQVDSRIYEGEGQRPYWNKIYLNGAHFQKDLRTRIGDEVFFGFLRDYLIQMRGKIATADDFFRILRQHTDADISDLITQYFQYPH